jgi:hypothetical protein
VTWDEALRCWKGDDPLLVASLRADRRFRKPVLNTENGYEYLRGQPTERNQVHHTHKVRRSSWRIVCAGGYFSAGFNGTIGHSDIWNRLDRPNHYTFTVRDEGAGAQLGLLYDYFTALPVWKLEPFKGVRGPAVVALADPGNLYVAYLPAGGRCRWISTGIEARSRPAGSTRATGSPKRRSPSKVAGLANSGHPTSRTGPCACERGRWDRSAPAIWMNGRAPGGQITSAAPRRRRHDPGGSDSELSTAP